MADVSYRITVDPAAVGRAVGPTLARTAMSATRRVTAQAKMNAPVDTGNLARSIEELPLRFVSPFRVDTGVIARANYARYVHDGTRPHVIRPRNARALHFQVDGKDVFTRLVNHPGTKARPFLRNAAETVMRGYTGTV